MTDTGLRKGLLPFDPAKHARFSEAQRIGFSYAPPTYPIDKTRGITAWGMDGNGPDPALTVNGANPVGNCGVCAVPAHANMLTAVLAGLDLAANTMTSDQTVTLYFIYQAEKAGIAWRPPGAWTQADIDQAAQLDLGVDLGDWLLWLFHRGLIEGFVKVDLPDLDAALATFDVVVVGADLNPQADQQAVSGQPWDVGPGDLPDPNEGHAILYLRAASPTGPFGWCTWGTEQPSTLAWKQGCPRQAFAVLTRQEAESKGFAAAFAILVRELHALGGTVVPDPTPPVPPRPVPVPVPAPACSTARDLGLELVAGTALVWLENAALRTAQAFVGAFLATIIGAGVGLLSASVLHAAMAAGILAGASVVESLVANVATPGTVSLRGAYRARRQARALRPIVIRAPAQLLEQIRFVP